MTVAERPPVAENSDVMSIGKDSEFALNLWTLIGKHNLHRVIETGTYIATGTTAIIASALDDLIDAREVPQNEVAFYTIEANKAYVDIARENLKGSGFHKFTQVLHGLSIPKALLPTPAEIKKWVVDEAKDLPVAVEHHESDRVYRYYSETDYEDLDDRRLDVALGYFGNRPDLVVLDSAGHIGLQEFQYLISNVHGPCFLALDDVFHVKHYRSLQFMLGDNRFDIRCLGKEKFGYCLARFTP